MTARPEDVTVSDVRPRPGRTPSGGYTQSWPAYNRAQVREKDEFMILLGVLCRGVEEPPPAATGRPPLSLRDLIFAAVLKVYSARSARRSMCDLEVARERGLITHLPHYNSILNVMGNESLTPVLQQLITESALPLSAVETVFAADSTGISTRCRRQWYDRHKAKHRSLREWVKLHVMVGVQTNIITHAVVSEGKAADSPFFPELIRHTAAHFKLVEVSADAGYLAAENQRAALLAGGVPYIAYRSNSVGSDWVAKSSFWNWMLDLYRKHHPEFMNHYYRRNNVETSFFMLKEKFGGRVRGKSFTTQANEALCMALCHNLCVVIQSMHELGIAPAFWAEVGGDVQGSKTKSSVEAEGGRDRLAPVLKAMSKMSQPKAGSLQPSVQTVTPEVGEQLRLRWLPSSAGGATPDIEEHQQLAETRKTSSSTKSRQKVGEQPKLF